MQALLSSLLAKYTRGAAVFRTLYVFDRPGCRVRLTVRQRLPLALFPLLVLGYLVHPAPVIAMSTAALGLLLLLSYLWARAMAQKLTGERRLRYAALQVGDELEEEIKLKNASALPAVWAEFVDYSNLPGYTVSSVRSADSKSTIEWHANTICTRRGVFTLGPWDLRLGDPFGLFLVCQTYLQKNDVLVYPPLAPLPQRLLPRGQVLGEQRPLRQPLVAETQDAFTARPYQPGDPLRHIHWPVTARHDSPFVKVFEPEDASTVWLIGDLDAGVQAGQGADSSLETIILLLASLASELLRQRLAVGLLAYSGDGTDVPKVVLPQRSSLHLWDILRTLAVLTPAPGRPLAKTLQQSRALVGGRDQVLVVTPSLQPSWLGALHQLNHSRHGQGASLVLLDPASFGEDREAGPLTGADTLVRPYAPGTADIFAGVLLRQGIHTNVIRRGELRPLSGTYGELNRWEFKTLGTGRVFVRHAPRQAAGQVGK